MERYSNNFKHGSIGFHSCCHLKGEHFPEFFWAHDVPGSILERWKDSVSGSVPDALCNIYSVWFRSNTHWYAVLGPKVVAHDSEVGTKSSESDETATCGNLRKHISRALLVDFPWLPPRFHPNKLTDGTDGTAHGFLQHALCKICWRLDD